MTRILFWNVNNVGTQSLFPSAAKRARLGNEEAEYRPGARPQAIQDGEDRLDVLTGVIGAVAPHIVSIAEVCVGGGERAEGATVADGAMLRLCRVLRETTPWEDWRLVPPLVVGFNGLEEGAAVFYRSSVLKFLGPWGWSGALAEPIGNIEAEGAELATYGAPWGAGGGYLALPGRAIGAGWPTPNGPENRLAAQWQYEDAEGNRINFPGEGNRGPLLTMFGQFVGPGAPRVIKLLSYHAPPQQAEMFGEAAPSRAGTAALAQITEMNAVAMEPDEVRCIVGDFNVSAWVDAFDAGSYQPLRELGYIQHLNPRGRETPMVEGPAALEYGWPTAGYYATHGRAVNLFNQASGANPWINTGEEHAVQGYPGFGWASRPGEMHGRYDAIDGVFTRHGAEAGEAGPLTIANPITGSPYNAVEAPAGVAVGAVVMGSRMFTPGLFGLPAGVPQLPQEAGLVAWNAFRNWDNYGKIRSLSDHLPIAIDV